MRKKKKKKKKLVALLFLTTLIFLLIPSHISQSGTMQDVVIAKLAVAPTLSDSSTLEEQPTVRRTEQSLYEESKEMYLSGEWDGMPMVLDDRTISISPLTGRLLLDDIHFDNAEILDFPVDMDNSFLYTYAYIPQNGIYAIHDDYFIKYVRGKMTTLSIGKLDYAGFHPDKPEAYGLIPYDDSYFVWADNPKSEKLYKEYYYPSLFWDAYTGNLFLLTIDAQKDVEYLYIFSDYNQAEITLVDTLRYTYCPGDVEAICYEDTHGQRWMYEKDGPVKVQHFPGE